MLTLKSFLKAGAVVVVCAAGYFGYTAYRAEQLEEAEERLEQDGMELAKRQQFMMTRDPQLNSIPSNRLVQADNMRRNLIATGRTASLPWQERGPSNVGGRTRAILIDRADATGNTVLAASVSGGIFRSTNFLSTPVTWTPVADRMGNLAVTCLWQDRSNASIIYAGTGEGWFNIDAVKGAGVFRSTDGGLTWALLPSTASFEYIQDLVQDNNGYLYVSLRNSVSTLRGIMRSTNAGATWDQVAGLPFTNLNYRTGRAADLEVASNGDVYATLGIFSPGMVIKSAGSNGTNTGTSGTWVDVTPPFTVATNRCELAIAPSNPNRLYLFGQDSTNSQVSECFRSDNGGQSWINMNVPAGVNNGNVSQNWYNLTSAVDPTNPDVVVVGGFNVARTTDGGGAWSTISTNTPAIHVDQQYLVYGNSSRLIVGNDGGIFVTNNADGSTPLFENKNNGFNVTQFYGADFHPTNANFFLAGAQDNNTQRFNGAGIQATTAVVGGDGGIPHIDQTDGNLQIAAYVGNSYYRSLNGGNSFTQLSGNNSGTGQFINPTDFDDVAKVLYCGDEANKMTVITNLTGSPARVTRTISAMASREITAVRVDPLASNTVWIGCSFGSAVPQIIKLTNANTATPVVSVNATIGSVASAAISSIEVDPADNNHLIVTLSNFGITSVFESTNGGTAWTAIEGNLPDMPVYWAMIVPAGIEPNGVGNGSGGIMIGTDLGVWYTMASNGGSTTWLPYANFPNTPVYMLKYRDLDRTVMAATHGRGLWTTVLTRATGVSNVTATRDFIKYVSSANNRLTIVPGNLNTRRMTVEVYNTAGSLVHRETRAYSAAQLPVDRWSRGAYIVRITGDKGEVFVQQVVR
ncbi:MAG: T9SS type A sorting domain-containing protein [Chitinophagaceae bacterium]|nr:MAG: T9SS type A sorting domain-containing protein [Chitinophagaceae bacterium]